MEYLCLLISFVTECWKKCGFYFEDLVKRGFKSESQKNRTNNEGYIDQVTFSMTDAKKVIW